MVVSNDAIGKGGEHAVHLPVVGAAANRSPPRERCQGTRVRWDGAPCQSARRGVSICSMRTYRDGAGGRGLALLALAGCVASPLISQERRYLVELGAAG